MNANSELRASWAISRGALCSFAESVKMATTDYSMLQSWFVNCCVAPITRRRRTRENDDCATQKCLIRRRSYCYITRRAAIEQAAITSSASCRFYLLLNFLMFCFLHFLVLFCCCTLSRYVFAVDVGIIKFVDRTCHHNRNISMPINVAAKGRPKSDERMEWIV